jgi:hypothetical protein
VRGDVVPAGTGAGASDGASLPAGLRPEEISARLLGELVDSYTVEFSAPDRKEGWLVKRHRPEVETPTETTAAGRPEATPDSGGSNDG